MENSDIFGFSQNPLKDSMQPIRISEDVRMQILNQLKNRLSGEYMGGHCFFRRFDRLCSHSENAKIIKHLDHESHTVLQSTEGISSDDMKRYVEIVYRSFSGVTKSGPVRNEHEPLILDFVPIFIKSKNYCQLDVTTNASFVFSPDQKSRNPITPYNGDLIFIFMSNETVSNFQKAQQFLTSEKTNANLNNKNRDGVKGNYPTADIWCIVSDQFLRAWTAIMYDWHELFDTLIPRDTPKEDRENALKSSLFKGNKLMTNALLKYRLATEESAMVADVEEMRRLYWHYRSEYCSKKWVDVYAALVLIARYGELPCPVNVPNNKGSSTRPKKDNEITELNEEKKDNEITELNEEKKDLENAVLISDIEARRLHLGKTDKKDQKIPMKHTWNLPPDFVSKLFVRYADIFSYRSFLINVENWRKYSKTIHLFSWTDNNGKNTIGFIDDISRIRYDKLCLPRNEGDLNSSPLGKSLTLILADEKLNASNTQTFDTQTTSNYLPTPNPQKSREKRYEKRNYQKRKRPVFVNNELEFPPIAADNQRPQVPRQIYKKKDPYDEAIIERGNKKSLSRTPTMFDFFPAGISTCPPRDAAGIEEKK